MNARVLAALLLAATTAAIAQTARQSNQPRKFLPREVTAAEVMKERPSGRVLHAGGVFDPITERPDFSAVGLPAVQSGEYAIVQLADAKAKADLERIGVRFFGYLPDNAWQVRVAPQIKKSVATHAAVRWMGDYEPGFKVHPRLWPSRTDEILNLRIVPFADLGKAKLMEMLKDAAPGLVSNRTLDQFVEVSIPAGSADDFIRKVSAIEGIRWIEPDDGMQLHNSSSSMAIQGNSTDATGRSIFARGITGSGQIIAVADSGLDSDMCYFRFLNGVEAVTDAASAITDQPGPLHPKNKVIGYWVQEGADAYDDTGAHGTHTAGTVAGDNIAHPSSGTDAGIDNADGMAPNAQILFQDIGAADGKLRGGSPYDMFLQAARGGARVHSNSYGSPSKGAYTAYDQLVDQYLFDHDEMTVVFSAGNDGPTTSSVGTPGNSKNVISVGAVSAGISKSVTLFSSRGPTADGRVKPDIVAPGQHIVSAGGDLTHGNTNCGTSSKQGTSMSAPTVAGGAALVRQYFAEGFYPSGSRKAADGFNASATLVKAVLLNGTIGLPETGEAMGNFRFGWGKIHLDSNLYFTGDTRRMRVWDLPNAQGLSTGDTLTFDVNIAQGQPFRATLVWTDPEGTPGAAKVLVNDLDMTVTNSAGTFIANVFGTDGNSAAGGSPDRLNNVEQVAFTAPAGGKYTITVRGTNIPGNGRSGTDHQGFALVVSGANCSTSVSAVPANLQVKTNANRGVDVTWTPASGSTVTQVYRAVGTNPNAADFRYIGSSTGSSFTDVRAQGGYTYSYLIRAADDCSEGPISSIATITAQGLCDIAPNFAGLASAQADGTSCRIKLSWSSATSNCPLGNSIRYNIWRSTTPDFVPTGAPYATTTERAFDDTAVTSGVTYHYIVRAEDSTTASAGPNRGNQENNSIRLFATAFGAPNVTGTWRDTAGDEGAYLTPDVPWQISKVEAHSGGRSYHNAVDNDLYLRNTCAALTMPPTLLDANAELSYWVRYNLEWEWDGVIVEISEDGGTTWKDLPPNGGYPATLADTQGTTGAEPPANVCGYLRTQGAFTGPDGNLDLTPWKEYKTSLSAYAGKTVQIRWRFTSDPGLEYEGFYLDDIAITNAKVPGACTAVLVLPDASFDIVPGFPSKGKPTQFRDRSTGVPTSWLWNFGDGATSTQQNPTHTYNTTGTFTVTLQVTNAAGTDSLIRTVTVSEPGKGGKRRSVH